MEKKVWKAEISVSTEFFEMIKVANKQVLVPDKKILKEILHSKKVEASC
jgi:hypothetical protein